MRALGKVTRQVFVRGNARIGAECVFVQIENSFPEVERNKIYRERIVSTELGFLWERKFQSVKIL